VKLSFRKRLNRRDLVKVMGGAAFCLPLLELFSDEVIAQVAPKKSKYIVFVYTPDGVNQRAFWPTNAADASSSPTLSVFAPYKDKMLVLAPRLNNGLPENGTGLTYNRVPLQHQAIVTLTGSSSELPYTPDQFKAVNKIDGPSVDYLIGEALATADGQNASLYPYLNFGMHPIGGDTPSEINFDQGGNPLRRMATADEVWERLFEGVPATDGGMSGAEGQLRRLNSTHDYLNARFQALRPELSAHDRTLLDAHLASLATYKDTTTRKLMESDMTAECGGPAAARAAVPEDDTSVRTGADSEHMSPFFMESIAVAFACKKTRVASVTFGYPGGGDAGGLRMPWLGFTDSLHGVSHHANRADMLEKYQKMNGWVASQVKLLMDKLAAVTTPEGTLLDQTTIYWYNRHGDGDAHTNFALPNIILGGTGGYFRMGQVLTLPATSPTKVLISLANSMGVELAALGSGVFRDTQPLSGLTA
jgi:hypothetical protein